MLDQNRTLRGGALGRFPVLLRNVTRNPAMALHLSLADSDPEAPNENFARELMELYTLGRGYSERDIRQAARALTGFRSDLRDDGNVLPQVSGAVVRRDAGRAHLRVGSDLELLADPHRRAPRTPTRASASRVCGCSM
jgi:uncharacterized protein (DUF1800 family)